MVFLFTEEGTVSFLQKRIHDDPISIQPLSIVVFAQGLWIINNLGLSFLNWVCYNHMNDDEKYAHRN